MTRVLVFGDGPGDRYRAPRTLRALQRAGLAPLEHVGRPLTALGPSLTAGEPVWLLRAGAWPGTRPAFPVPSGTGRPLCALGAVRPAPPDGSPSEDWARLLAATGGDLGAALPAAIESLYLEPALARAVAAGLARQRPLREAVAEAIQEQRARVVRFAPLDVHFDPALRVAQVVTSLQQGGAERIALELAGELPRQGVRTLLVALGGPTRPPFPAPAGTIDLAWERDLDHTDRATRLAAQLVTLGADLVHGHLLEGPDLTRLAAGPPLLLTFHNVREGWPAGIQDLRAGEAALLVGCARAVEADLRAAALPAPVRTVWNGIDVAASAPTPEREAGGHAWREWLGFGADDFVLLALANPRPQKRLHLLPAVLAATRATLARLGCPREARLVLAGSASRASDAALAAERQIALEARRLGVAGHVRAVGSVDDVASLLRAADVLVSSSAYEGLSLAQLEALAAMIPVVATDAGGTRELAHGHPAVTLLPLDAGPERFADTLASLATAERRRQAIPLSADFSRARMAEGYARLYPRAIEAGRGRRRGEGLLLVTNNFSTGGAQSSARRLLKGLASEGVRVRAAVLEEQPEHSTPGRQDLLASGIPVLALPPPDELDSARAITRLLEWLDADPPEAVLLWNAIAEHKLLLADALLDVPLYDVSPGEMYFASLERYFARPRPGLPYRTPAEYAARLAGVVVKYREAARAAEVLGAPVHVIPNGVPVGHMAPSRREAEPLVIGTLARIAPHKKLEELLEALRRANGSLPPHVLRIAGGVERGAAAYAAQLRARAQDLAVEWVGELYDARPFLRGLDLFALVAEPAGCPNASLEAMAEGLPVVATDVGGAREQIEDGVCGRLVPPSDADALAEALAALAGDPGARTRFGAAARQRVASDFSLRRMVADYRRVCLGGA